MAIAFVGYRSFGKSNSPSTVGLSSGLTGGSRAAVATGDLVVAIFSAASTTDVALTITDGTNPYTLIDAELYSNGSSVDANLRVAYKFMGGTPDSDTTFGSTVTAGNGGIAAVHVFSGVDPTTPLDVAAVAATGTGTGLANPPSITPTTTGAVVLGIGTGAAATGAVFTSSDLTSGFESRNQTTTRDSFYAAGHIAWAGGPVDPAVFGGGTAGAGDSWAAMSIALRPAIANTTITAAAGSHAVTGTAATLKFGRKAAAAASSHAVTGTAASLEYGFKVLGAAGSHAVAGQSATFPKTWIASAAAGSYAATGQAASLERTYIVPLAAGSYAVTGSAASLYRGAEVAAAAGSYAASGSDAALEIEAVAISVSVDSGGYSVSGQVAALELGYEVVAGAGSYAVSGTTATLQRKLSLVASAGSYAATGQAATLKASGWFLVSNVTSQTDAGPASSLVSSTVSADVGQMLVVGVASSNSGTSGAPIAVTCTDSAGNTYTQRSQTNNTAGAADDGITLTIFTTVVTSPLVSGSITVSFSPSSAEGSVMTVQRYTPALGESAQFIAAGAGATGTNDSPTITSGSIASADVIIGFVAVESTVGIGADNDTSNGTWSTTFNAQVGTGTSAARINTQRKPVTTSGAQTYNPTLLSNADWAINYIVIRSAQAAATTIAADAASYAASGAAATLKRALKVSAAAGSHVVTGTAAGLLRNRAVAAASGPYLVTGFTASLKRPGSYLITGKAVGLVHGYIELAGAGSYVVTGVDAVLALEGVALLSAAPGAYAVSGADATLEYGVPNRLLLAEASSYSTIGFEVALDVAPFVEPPAIRPGGGGSKKKFSGKRRLLTEDEIRKLRDVPPRKKRRRVIWEKQPEPQPATARKKTEVFIHPDLIREAELEVRRVGEAAALAMARGELDAIRRQREKIAGETALRAAEQAELLRAEALQAALLRDEENAILALLLAA